MKTYFGRMERQCHVFLTQSDRWPCEGRRVRTLCQNGCTVRPKGNVRNKGTTKRKVKDE